MKVGAGKTIEEQIARGKELLQTVRHAAMATVNEDGSPHNTPLVLLHSDDLKHVYWGSHPDSQHSKNLLRTGELFTVIYEANERGGLFIRAVNAKVVEGKELEAALAVYNKARKGWGKGPLSTEYYNGDSPQRMWSAEAVQFWVNASERDAEGNVLKDIRTEVKASDLL